MKKLIMLLAVCALFSITAFAKAGNDVPANVKNAFTQKFPKITNAKWENEKGKEWEAEFKMDGKAYTASFDMNGNWMETEYKISEKEIPAPVQKTITSDFKDYKIKKSEMSETANGKKCEFEMKKGAEKKEVVIDMNGKVLKNELAKDEKAKEVKDVKEPVKKDANIVKQPVQKVAKEPKATTPKEPKVK